MTLRAPSCIMYNMNKSRIPFVGLHAHSTAGSPFDAIGYPQQHMDFAYQNGCDALALTDHGNCNGLAYQVLHAKTMEKEGKNFKPIYGMEAYFIPSIKEWERAKEDSKIDKKNTKIKESSGFSLEDEAETKSTKDILNRRRHLLYCIFSFCLLRQSSNRALRNARLVVLLLVFQITHL